MRNEGHDEDITRTLISSAYILRNLHNFFPHALFLDRQYNIVAVSSKISMAVGYSPEELSGLSVSVLQQNNVLVDTLRSKLLPGYFSNETIVFRKKSGAIFECQVSGFYVGILCPGSDMIALNFSHDVEIAELTTRLQKTHEQIDNFIYRTAHDLRGPLATIQGLIMLLNMRADDSEVDKFTGMIESHCKKLEERLTTLVYLAKVEEEFATPSFQLRIDDLETSLRKAIERNSFVDYLELTVSGSSEIFHGHNEELIKSAATNILMYVVSLRQILHSDVRISVSERAGTLYVTLFIRGFEKDPRIEQVLLDADGSYYVDALQSSRFTYLFAAQKIAARMKGFIRFRMQDPNTQQITLTIPPPTSQH
jgi:signal transduction histidine kinase